MLKLPLARSELRLGIAPDGIALLDAGGRRGPNKLLAESGFAPGQREAPPALAEAARAMLKTTSCSGRGLSIVLADHWVRLFMVTPPQNAGSLQDCQAAAAMRFHDLYGDNLAAWELQADWDAHHAFLACAMPKDMLGMLQQAAAEFRLVLLSITPQFVAAWNRWNKQLDGNAWFGVTLGDRLTLGAIEGGVLRAVNGAPVADANWQDEHWLPAHLAREALRLNLSTPQQLQLCGRIAGIPATRAEIARGCKRLDAGQAVRDAAAASPALTLARTGLPA